MLKPLLSISIVSYNNIQALLTCIESIIISVGKLRYEIIIIAYKYSKQNVQILTKRYPDFTVIQNNDLSGFSENHNLALRYAKGKYWLILNDDTYFTDASILHLVQTMEACDDIHILSPIIYNPDHTIQFYGRPKFTPIFWIIRELRLDKLFFRNGHLKKINDTIYETFHITGSCFIIRSDLMKSLGYFDEDYFFSPEDIMLSAEARKRGYNCYLDTQACVFHELSATAKPIHQIILPVSRQGLYLFFRKQYNHLVELIIRILTLIISLCKLLYWFIHIRSAQRKLMIKIHYNLIRFAFIDIDCKLLFQKLYGSEAGISN